MWVRSEGVPRALRADVRGRRLRRPVPAALALRRRAPGQDRRTAHALPGTLIIIIISWKLFAIIILNKGVH